MLKYQFFAMLSEQAIARVEVDMDSSCSRWGHVDGPAYIVGYVRRLEGKPAVFSARSFRLAQIQRNPVPRRK